MGIKKKFLILLVLVLVFLPLEAGANDNHLVDIDLYIDQEGDGYFNTTYEYYDSEGTEHYIVIENLGSRELTDYSVTRNGQPMEYVDNWDIDASFEEKAGKYGIVKTDQGYELCFAITEYGPNTFVVSYRITDIIQSLIDYDMLSWRFLNPGLSENPDKIQLKIYSDQNFVEESIRMWAFGFEGEINLEGGHIVARSLPNYRYNHMTVLLRFEKGYFQGGLVEDEYFDTYADQMFEGSSYDTSVDPDGPISDWEYGDNYQSQGLFDYIEYLIPILVPIIVGIVGVVGPLIAKHTKPKFQYDKNAIYQDGYYYRDTQDMEISDFYYILSELGESEFENYISAYFLKWLREGQVTLKEREKGVIIKKTISELKLEESNKKFASKQEERLFNMMKNAAGQDGILQEKEFSKYISSNTSSFENLMEYFNDSSKSYLIYEKYIDSRQDKGLIGSRTVLRLSPKGEDLAKNLVGFKNYLKDYSLLEERDAVNVHLWDSYMVYAAIFGITKEVSKQFEALYPRYVQESYYSPSTIYWTNYYSRSMVKSYNSARSSSSSSASGGFGGGTSFGGGGGGFSGGGSGGGSR